MFKELYDVLPPYGQVWLTIVIVLVGGVMAWKGLADKKKEEASQPREDHNLPMWTMMGPVHEGIQSVHEISRSSENTLSILRDMDKKLDSIDRGQQYTHYVLEALLREQSLNPLPPRDPRYRRP